MSTPLYALVGNMERAVQIKAQLLAAGVRQRAIRTLILPMPERGHMGNFADSGDHAHTAARDHVGSFADSGDHAHTAVRDHVGSFAAHLHADDILRELIDAGVPDAEAARCVDQMGHGAMVLLINVDGQPRMAAQGILQAA